MTYGHHLSGHVVSRHLTSEGVLVYLRCDCGALELLLQRWGDGTDPVLARRHGAPLARSDPPRAAHCG
jgi:hypothetical protein